MTVSRPLGGHGQAVADSHDPVGHGREQAREVDERGRLGRALLAHIGQDGVDEIVDLADVEGVIRLLTALALRLESDTSLARW